ncbi:MAG: O-linked N-acetylglucosamine transferase, SPINDLY family protein [Microcystis sp.]|jgi:predicted O-linked N-acetylglucosamine transferase (SPINDLY family)|uniref:O-linked N-acetylglucosamine transferase, SPINDLY family protein n=2 Tax=Microcystis TaxID=1125 RepID=UPI0022C8EA9C|nr:O-linked N-acetylglucosamine transferase, SPINDLY family protein [Microcystis sp. 49638_E5]MCE2669154.1 O-linked N-acetylglucosamine transferase, SPINDLY family protein [Microcystis sp. 49638_E5]MCZ8055867.1 O-linked N-acetylglucosamine transferase, SPINDLY family protein [Microcystis sp. LE19-12.2C]
MSWQNEVKTALENNQYDIVSQFYEELIEKETTEISHYWYLGLSYLLQAKEEQAQATWLFVFTQGDEQETDSWMLELSNILTTEANRQLELENLETSWLIRKHLQEINPSYLDNLLHLTLIEIKLNRFDSQQLQEWQILELITQGSVNSQLLERVVIAVIPYAHEYTIELVRLSLPYLGNSPELLNYVITVAGRFAFEKYQAIYSVDLAEAFLPLYPESLYLEVNLFWFYISLPDYEKAINLVNKLKEKSQTIDLKMFSQSLLFSGSLRASKWNDIPSICQEYKHLIKEFIEKKPQDIHPLVRGALLTVMNPISYYEDNPKENRPLLSQIGSFFQETYKEMLGFQEESFDKPREDNANKKLKIGYIAQTLKHHPVGLLSRWTINYHNREQFDIHLYMVSQPVDEITKQWFSNPADKIYHATADSLTTYRKIKEDNIDILVDLDSGTGAIVAQVIALKPAPIQVNWLGFDGSGLPAVDYLLADPYVLPENAQEYYQEKIWRLPNTFVAVDGFEIAVPTLRREDLGINNDAVIYLSSQTAIKRNPAMIRLQMQILKSVPNSYFLIQGVADDNSLLDLFCQIAAEVGVETNRIKMLPLYQTETYRANLAIADVVLDTYPFNGGTTTLETLWMGIPLVVKVGQQWSSRNGYTLMMNAGITEGIAWSDEEYVQWGIKLGLDKNLREEVRWKLRKSRHTSPLWNAKQFTRDLENAYRQMWNIYCQS